MCYTCDAAEILDLEFGGDPIYEQMRVDERAKSQAAQAIYDARQAAGLTRIPPPARLGLDPLGELHDG